MDFYHLLENRKKKLMDTGPNSLKTSSKRQSIKQVNLQEIKSQTNQHDVKIVKTKPLEEIIIPPEKKLIEHQKWNTINYLSY